MDTPTLRSGQHGGVLLVFFVLWLVLVSSLRLCTCMRVSERLLALSLALWDRIIGSWLDLSFILYLLRHCFASSLFWNIVKGKVIMSLPDCSDKSFRLIGHSHAKTKALTRFLEMYISRGHLGNEKQSYHFIYIAPCAQHTVASPLRHVRSPWVRRLGHWLPLWSQ